MVRGTFVVTMLDHATMTSLKRIGNLEVTMQKASVPFEARLTTNSSDHDTLLPIAKPALKSTISGF